MPMAGQLRALAVRLQRICARARFGFSALPNGIQRSGLAACRPSRRLARHRQSILPTSQLRPVEPDSAQNSRQWASLQARIENRARRLGRERGDAELRLRFVLTKSCQIPDLIYDPISTDELLSAWGSNALLGLILERSRLASVTPRICRREPRLAPLWRFLR